MSVKRKLIALFALALLGASAAADAPFTGAFMGGGRACYGGLYVRTKTVEWNSVFSKCKRAPYEVVDRILTPGRERIAMRITRKEGKCPFEVIELEEKEEWGWTARGYQTLESYEKREVAEWKNSPLEERDVLRCQVYRTGTAGTR